MGETDVAPHSLVVADAGPLIHLHELGALDLLSDYTSILVPPAVWDEVERHRPAALTTGVVRLERVDAVVPSLELQAVARLHALHAGEAEALALCEQHSGSRLLTDDTAARLAAKGLGVAASGTLGILLRGLRRGQRSKEQIIALLEAIPTHTSLHVRPSLLNEVIAEVLAT